MTDHVLYLQFSLNSEDALSDALMVENLDLSEKVLYALEEQLPSSMSLKIFFDDEDVDGTFDIVDEDIG